MPAIEITRLSKQFKTKKGIVEAVKPLSLSVERGEVFGFLGPNGAGKSTTIKILTGFLKPTSGTAKISDCPIDVAESRRSVGYLPENPNFFDYLTAEEYLKFVTNSFGIPAKLASTKIDEVLHLLELWDARKRLIRSYSKGMVQRVGLAQALVHDPEILILDEPMSGLDPIGRSVVKNIILDMKQKGKTVFFSTHIISDIEAVCDRVGIIFKGELKVNRPVHEIIAEGLDGYSVAFSSGDNKQTTEFIQKDALAARISELAAANQAITLIEPHRKSLEDFFLQIVQKNS